MRHRKSPSHQAVRPGCSRRTAWRGLLLFVLATGLNFTDDQLFTREALSNIRKAGLSSQTRALPAGTSLGETKALARLGGGQPDTTVTPETLEPRETVVVKAAAENVEQAPTAFELQLQGYADPQVQREIVQFGYEVFGRMTSALTDIPVGKDYVLGTGDSLIVSMWGNPEIDQDHFVDIDRDGQVRLPLIGPQALKGLSLGRAEELLRRRFDRFFQNYGLEVNVAKIRDMSVHVTGHVRSPGRIRVPSVATLFDALSAAGGVTKEGSLRRVRLKRSGEQARTYDLYDYLLEGDPTVDIHLTPNDVIVLPSVGSRVAVVGRVLRPAIYEQVDPDISFSDVLGMAGGYARLADRSEIQVESTSDRGLSIRTVNLEETSGNTVRLGDSDVVIVRGAPPRVQNAVYLRGNVARAGRYAFKKGMRVADIVTEDVLVEAGFWLRRTPPGGPGEPEKDGEQEKTRTGLPEPYPEPFLEYALISRIHPRTKQESQFSFHLGKAIIDRDPKENHLLEPQDTVVIFPRKDFEGERTVYVSGAVHQPRSYDFYPGMRVLDLVRMSGGLVPHAHLGSATLTRVHANQQGAEYEHLVVDLNRVLAGDDEANLPLQQFDSLTVKAVADFKTPYRITLDGEVRHPGRYSVIPGERLADLLRRAGGFTEHAYLPSARFYRESVRRIQQDRLEESLKRMETEAKLASQKFTAEASILSESQVGVAAEQARIDRLVSTLRAKEAEGRMVIHLRDPDELEGTPDDIELMNGDSLIVPRRPEIVFVVGAVFNQNALLHREGMTARQFLQECGGAMDSAETDVAYIVRADGSADSAMHSRKGYRWDAEKFRYSRGDLLSSEMYPGDTLVIPYDVKPQLSRLGLTKTVTQIMFQAVMTTGIIVALF